MWRSQLLKLAANANRTAGRRFSTRAFAFKQSSSRLMSTTIGFSMGLTGYWLINQQVQQQANTASCDSGEEMVQPKTSVKPFPKTFEIAGSSYQLLGLGVRTVTLLSFHVYAVGIYIAEADKPKAKAILSGFGEAGEDLEKALMDPNIGMEAVTKILENNVRILLRIVPVRKTDFGHLRDGFVRAVTDQPRFKTQGNNEFFGKGLQELKVALGRRMSVKKDTILNLLRDENGVLHIEWFSDVPDYIDNKAGTLLGEVNQPMVSEFLFSKYLAGKSVSSEEARKSTVQSLAHL